MLLYLMCPVGTVANAHAQAFDSNLSNNATPPPDHRLQLNYVYNFCSKVGSNAICNDGVLPSAGLIQGSSGSFYGTTTYGGTRFGGSVFEVNSAGIEKVLYSFCPGKNCESGGFPEAGLIRDAAGNLYGTTVGGANLFGVPNTSCTPPIFFGRGTRYTGCGTVFKLDTAGHESVLYRFCSESNCVDGANPFAGLAQDAAGNLYGTTLNGGYSNCQKPYAPPGCGTVFKLDNTGHYSVLYAFCPASSCGDGANPLAGLILDSDGNLYGTTSLGGTNGAGTVFKIDTAGNETVLYSFCSLTNCVDGESPAAALLMDATGNLYGTTASGGAHNSGGTVFELVPPTQPGDAWSEEVLYSFCKEGGINCYDGSHPVASLIQDAAGTLYGTTEYGGAAYGGACGGCGTVFKLLPRPGGVWKHRVLYIFCEYDGDCQSDGEFPVAGLLQDASGNLYGTTSEGGVPNAECINFNGVCGSVFVLTSNSPAITLTSNANPSGVGQPVTFSVVVSGVRGTPTGSVTLTAGKTDLGTVQLSDGEASLTTTFTKVDVFSVIADFSGGGNYVAKKSRPLKQVVTK